MPSLDSLSIIALPVSFVLTSINHPLYCLFISGMIPLELGCLTTLQQLELQGNALTGSIPPELGALVNLQYLGLHENQLLGACVTMSCVLSV